jgi:hypothetical protein
MLTPGTHQAADVSAWCASAHANGLGVFVLFDPPTNAVPSFRPSPQQRQLNLFAERTGDPQALQIGPRLIEVPNDDAVTMRVARMFVSQSAEQPEMLLISSPLKLDSLAKRLSTRFDVSAAGEEMLLRLWDARIFYALVSALEPPNRELVFALGSQALVPDRQGGHAIVALTLPSHDPLQGMQLSFSQSELDALLERSNPDAILAMVREISPELIQQIADAERYGLTQCQLAECEQRQLNSPRDQALALTLAIEHGPEWWHSPEWANCVQQASQSTLLNAYLATHSAW